MMQHISRFIASVLSPLLTPSYGVFLALWVSVICYQPLGTRLAVLLVVFGVTCVTPMIFISIMHNLKIIKDMHLVERKERNYPYLITIVCYVAAACYINHVHAPSWLVGFAVGGVMTCIVSFIVNLKWKISAHTAGMGGLVALLFFIHSEGLEAFNTFWLLCITIIISGIAGSVRMYQCRHDLGQVIAGFINGSMCVHFAIKFLY